MANKVKFVSLSSKVEEYKESTSFGSDIKYIKYGDNNQFDRYLIDMSKKSPLHSGVLDRKVKMDNGDGLTVPEGLQSFYNELPKDLTKKLFTDVELFGGCYVGVKWYQGKVIGLEHIPFEYVRLAEPNEDDIIDGVYVSKNWKKVRDERYKPVGIPVYNGENNRNDYEVAIISSYVAGQHYPLPSYYGAVNYIESDWQISKFHLANILNGFNPGAMIVFTEGQPTPEEEDTIVKNIQNSTGADNAGKFILYFATSVDKVPQITQLPVNDLDKQFQILNDTIDSKIITAHQIPRILAGLETPGSLGDSKQLLQANESFSKNYIGYQQKMLEDFFNEINEINGSSETVEFSQVKELNLALVEAFSQYLTNEEIREFLGRPKIEAEPIVNTPDNTEIITE